MSINSRTPFPKEPSEFNTDSRVSFSQLDSKYILEDHDGSEWEFSDAIGKWVPSLDEALAQQQQAAYVVPGVDEDIVDPRKRKQEKDDTEDGKSKRQKGSEKSERKNTAVYVTSLPPDATFEEINAVFSKCGVIAEEIDSGRPRIKLYLDEQGNVKGDALIVYFRPESVQLAIQMLDDMDFRFGEVGPLGKMRVKEADFSYKKQKEAPTEKSEKFSQDKKKIIRKTQKMNDKLADWGDDDAAAAAKVSSKWDKVVILKHMFTLQELDEDPAAILDIKEDVREECSKFGEVTNVTLYDKEKDGVVSVRFTTPQFAMACVMALRGRNFSGLAVQAFIADGTEKYKKSSERSHVLDEEGEEQEESTKRLDEFGSWLEKQGDGK